MNSADWAVIAVVLISGLLGLLRGFVREVLGLFAWVGAAVVAVALYDHLLPTAKGYVQDPTFAGLTAFAVPFLVALMVLSIVAGLIGRRVQDSLLGPVDRALGFGFGLGRGAVLVVAAFVLLGIAIAPEGWPAPLREAALLPSVRRAADWAVMQVPPDQRPYLGPAQGEPAMTTDTEISPMPPPDRMRRNIPFGHPDTAPPAPPRHFGP